MNDADVIRQLADLRDALEHDKLNHSTEERKDKLTAVIGHIQYAIQRMNASVS